MGQVAYNRFADFFGVDVGYDVGVDVDVVVGRHDASRGVHDDLRCQGVCGLTLVVKLRFGGDDDDGGGVRLSNPRRRDPSPGGRSEVMK